MKGKFFVVVWTERSRRVRIIAAYRADVGKSENIKTYTAKELEEMIERGEDQTNWEMSHEEAMSCRHAAPEAPLHYPGWERTVTTDLPPRKKHMNLRIDEDVVEWFKR